MKLKITKKIRGSTLTADPGDIVTVDNTFGKSIIAVNAAEEIKDAVETAEFIEEPEKQKVIIKSLGGGWYEVDGKKVQGKEEAEKLARE